MKTMNDEMKKLMSRFLLVSVFIGCVTVLFVGTVTAKQRSEYNSYHTEYALLTVKSQNSRVNVEIDEKSYSFDLSNLKKLKKYENAIYLTPLSPVFFLCECIFDIIYD